VNRSRLFLALACAALAVLLGAPAPGSVGGCGDENVPVDPLVFCDKFERLECERRAARSELDGPGKIQCLMDVADECRSFSFEAGCAPTVREADACITALTLRANIFTEFPDIPECGNLCP
jgi:hypothetical protein